MIDPSQSWGRHFYHPPKKIHTINWLFEALNIDNWSEYNNLAYGFGRSYGDLCLNDGGRLFLMNRLSRIQSWNPDTGCIKAEAGISLGQILDFAIPKGWFLPVTPGTKIVSLGGAVANDVHGKNHHRVGTLGRFIKSIQVLRSDGQVLNCSPDENSSLFKGTIGGLGLTGLILSVELQLIFASPVIETEIIPFQGIDEFTSLSRESQDYEYSVAWIDCINAWNSWGRGLFIRGQHSADTLKIKPRTAITMPMEAPKGLLNKYSCKAFNEIYYRLNRSKVTSHLQGYESFFYPLDGVHEWNKMYGSRGFFQYQLVVPLSAKEALIQILDLIAKSGFASFLAVLKTFGHHQSPGMLSFPKEGYTLSLDFSNKGRRTKQLLEQITSIVNDAEGRLYPAKDSIMKKADFLKYYPTWSEFDSVRDPHFSSSFIRRVMLNGEETV